MNKNFNIQLFAENLNTTATMSKEDVYKRQARAALKS